MAETLLKCTTRHVRLFTARLENDDLVISDDDLTMDLDPDNEFLWSESAVTKVQSRFKELVEQSAVKYVGGELGTKCEKGVEEDFGGVCGERAPRED